MGVERGVERKEGSGSSLGKTNCDQNTSCANIFKKKEEKLSLKKLEKPEDV